MLDAGAATPYIVLAALALGALLYARHFGGGEALSQLQTANGVLTDTVRKQEHKIAGQAAEIVTLNHRIADLEARTDFTTAMEPVLMVLRDHEENEAKRTAEMLLVLQKLVYMLGEERV
jgi:hypothetical protein